MPFFDAKAGIVELIKSLGLEWTSFVTNTWLEFAVGPFLGFDLKEGKVNVAGSGDWRFSVTSFKDVAVLASNAIQHPDATNNYVYFSANTISWNDLIAIVERAFGRKFERTTRTQEQLQVLIASIPESQGLVRLGLSLQELYAFYNENVDTGSKAFEKKHPEFFAGIKLLTAEEYAHALAKAQTN
jgi:nucleoside-diphosphate-sugar epimerase